MRFLATLVVLACASGCVTVQVGATNPIPGMSKVAVAPFFNLSQEPSEAVDGRRFAMAYFAELQKIPGYEVVPVGITEQAIVDNQLEMSDTEDVIALAEILGVDAIVVGAVTDYAPYYPPRIGLKVSWYSAKQWEFYPGLPIDEQARGHWKEQAKAIERDRKAEQKAHAAAKSAERGNPWQAIRGQSPSTSAFGLWQADQRSGVTLTGQTKYADHVSTNLPLAPPADEENFPQSPQTPKSTNFFNSRGESPSMSRSMDPAPRRLHVSPSPQPSPNALPPLSSDAPQSYAQTASHQPLMTYARIFDGADAELVARLQDYVELSGDLRSGGWEAYLHRSEDFVRFTAHLMIVEMLTLHGGEARHRWVFKLRNHR